MLYTIYYDKVFTSGPYKGITIAQYIPRLDYDRAIRIKETMEKYASIDLTGNGYESINIVLKKEVPQ